MSTQTEKESVASLHSAMQRAGRLHWFHWATIAFSLILTLSAYFLTREQVESRVFERFEREAQRVVEQVGEHMHLYEGALLGGVAAHDSVRRDLNYREWRDFASSIRIDERYPGINGIGVIHHVERSEVGDYLEAQRKLRPDFRVFPVHSEPELLPITFSEPESANAKAIGLDMAHEENRYQAARLAMVTGHTAITGPIVLVQDAEKTPGFLFYAPFYSQGVEPTVESRMDGFRGLVYAPFIMSKLMNGTLERKNRHVGVSISDDGQDLYNEHHAGESDFDPNPLFTKVISTSLFGRQWDFDIHSTLGFRQSAHSEQPTMILLGGLAIDSLLLVLFVLISRSNRRAIEYAEEMTGELRQRTAQLETSNEDLERFAHVASHDLRTPLRGVSDLVEYLGEDLEGYLEQENANPDVSMNLDRIVQQVTRMDDLIRGVLDYASVDKAKPEIKPMNLPKVISAIAFESQLREDQVILDLELESLQTESLLLGQVLANLIGNAAKYHDDLEHAEIVVRSRVHGEVLHFTVSDNGPGIDPQYHERIFEPFHTLQPRDEIESTGIGLAIVKKTVERQGGRVTVGPTPGGGTTFSFDWPLRGAVEEATAA